MNDCITTEKGPSFSRSPLTTDFADLTDAGWESVGNTDVTSFGPSVKSGAKSVFGAVLAAAILLLPRPAAADWALYASSYGNNKIIKYDTNGVATVFATNGVNGILNQPNGLVFDDLGNLYVANNGNNTIEKYDPQGNGTLFASSAGSNPNGLAFDSLNHLFVANYVGNSLFRITNALGQGSVFASGSAVLSDPQGLAFDSAGNLWVANPYGGWIEKFDPQGNGTKVYSANLQGVSCLAFDAVGNLYASGGNVVAKFDTQGNRTTFASGFSSAVGLAFDSTGNLYVADYGTYVIKKVTPQGAVTTFAGGVNSGLRTPTFIAIRETRYQDTWFKAAGGGTSTNAEFTLNGTTGQLDASPAMTGGPYGLVGGFWARVSAVPTPGAPALTITVTTTNTALVSWPSPSTGWNLQQNTDLATSNWVASPAPTDNGTIKYVIVNPPTGNLFFRLRQP